MELLGLFAMREPFFLELSGVSIHRSNLLKLGVEIYSYNDHCSAPFSRACWLASAPPTLLGPGSRHCHGINYTSNSANRPYAANFSFRPKSVAESGPCYRSCLRAA